MEILKNGDAAPQVNPREFNGQWFFTNPDTEDFTFSWNGTPYTFRAQSTTDFVIMDATPLEMQHIRKQAAYKLAQRMFGKSQAYKKLLKDSQGKLSPMHYDEAKELEPYAEQCLVPLPVAKTTVGTKKKREMSQRIDPTTGKPAVRVYGEGDVGQVSLVAEAENADL